MRLNEGFLANSAYLWDVDIGLLGDDIYVMSGLFCAWVTSVLIYRSIAAS